MKFSPVCTAFYRILPEITLNTKVQGEKAEELVAKCPMKVREGREKGGGEGGRERGGRKVGVGKEISLRVQKEEMKKEEGIGLRVSNIIFFRNFAHIPLPILRSFFLPFIFFVCLFVGF